MFICATNLPLMAIVNCRLHLDKRAESIAKRLSAFMPLLPGIVQSLLSASVRKTDPIVDHIVVNLIITDEAALAVGALKHLLTLVNLALQALYGSKKGGLVKARGDAKSGVQNMNRAKAVFVSGAKEHAPILLQVAALLSEPIQFIKARLDKRQYLSGQGNASSLQSEPTQRERVDSTDKDWVDVNYSSSIDPIPKVDIPNEAPSGLTMPPLIPNDDNRSAICIEIGPRPEQCVYNHLCSIQDMALYAVSRLIAQAMKYGGGEASTAVWRTVVAALPTSKFAPSTDMNGNNSSDATANKVAPRYDEKALTSSTLCHLAALVLSKFSRRHDESRSPWNLETCSSVARLMDLVEEKKLLSSTHSSSSRKYDIDQVRLLMALLEIMASGRESGGWLQSTHSSAHPLAQVDEKPNLIETNTKNNDAVNIIDKALPHTNYEMYHQAKNSNGASTSKLLLPILQSCVRIVLPATGIIRSEAVVITTATANSSSKLLDLVGTELHQSLVSAIEGLGFPIARDVFLNAIAALRRSTSRHELGGDTAATIVCSNLVVEITRAMRFRYLHESTRKERASFDAYENDENALNLGQESQSNQESSGSEKIAGSNEGIHSQVIEQLILGGNVVPRNDADFVAFPGDASRGDDPTKLFTSPMGWSHYKGLGAAINRCFAEDTTPESPEEKTKSIMKILHPYIDNWDKVQIQDEAEAELVDLFDESIHLNSTSKDLVHDFNVHGHSKGRDLTNKPKFDLIPSLSASDAMTRFIEAQSMIRHQHIYLGSEYLLRRRFGRTAFMERFCWTTWMDCVDSRISNCLWERVRRIFCFFVTSHCVHSFLSSMCFSTRL